MQRALLIRNILTCVTIGPWEYQRPIRSANKSHTAFQFTGRIWGQLSYLFHDLLPLGSRLNSATTYGLFFLYLLDACEIFTLYSFCHFYVGTVTWRGSNESDQGIYGNWSTAFGLNRVTFYSIPSISALGKFRDFDRSQYQGYKGYQLLEISDW